MGTKDWEDPRMQENIADRGARNTHLCKVVGGYSGKGQGAPIWELDLRLKWPEALKRDRVTKWGHGA